MEFKGDEAWMFAKSQSIGVSEPWPTLGMGSGVGIPNPALSVWIFVAIAKIFHCATPLDLTRVVSMVNFAAILMLFYFAGWLVPEREKKAWVWAASFMSISLFPVLFSRKIWEQDVLPFFTMPFYIAWWKRGTKAGAFFWGVLGICLGQIHMSGFFFGFAIFAWTLLFDRKSVRWTQWLIGTLLGSIPLLSWVQAILSMQHPLGHNGISFAFYQNWISDSLGLGVGYSLGPHAADFMQYPVVDWQPFYLVSLLTYFLSLSGCFLFVFGSIRCITRMRRADTGSLRNFALILIGKGTAGNFLIAAVLIVMGLSMSFLGIPIPRHYLIVTYPLAFLFLAKITIASFKKPEIILGTLCVAQFLITLIFLGYIHVNCGAPQGDYGVAFSCRDLPQNR
jgi:hypothetical protein